MTDRSKTISNNMGTNPDEKYVSTGFPEGTVFYRRIVREAVLVTYADIVYSVRDGVELDLQPNYCRKNPKHTSTADGLSFQGSVGLSRIHTLHRCMPCQRSRGFAVASVDSGTFHRHFSCSSGGYKNRHSLPAAMLISTAIAGEKVGIWGASSGGHTAALIGLAQPDYATDDYGQYPDDVRRPWLISMALPISCCG